MIVSLVAYILECEQKQILVILHSSKTFDQKNNTFLQSILHSRQYSTKSVEKHKTKQ